MNKQQRIEMYHYLDNHLGQDEMNYIDEICDEHEAQQVEIVRLTKELVQARELLVKVHTQTGPDDDGDLMAYIGDNLDASIQEFLYSKTENSN